MNITSEQLIKILGYKHKDIQGLTKALNETFVKYNIDSKLRIKNFLCQVIHESGRFVFMEEIWGNTNAQKSYEMRIDLGNNEKGDGFKFRGRGFIQITGKFNYSLISKDFNFDFVKNPDKLKEFPYSCLSAGWFWNRKNLNFFADLDDIKSITKKINGGYNGLEDRIKWSVLIETII